MVLVTLHGKIMFCDVYRTNSIPWNFSEFNNIFVALRKISIYEEVYIREQKLRRICTTNEIHVVVSTQTPTTLKTSIQHDCIDITELQSYTIAGVTLRQNYRVMKACLLYTSRCV